MYFHKLKFKTDNKINSEAAKVQDDAQYIRRKLDFQTKWDDFRDRR